MLKLTFIVLIVLISCKTNQEKKAATVDKSKNRPPNIVFILADDMGYNDWGCYGQDKIKTPNIDKMASEGMMFTNHYAGSSVCAPSRSSLFSGQHTGHTSVRGNWRNMETGVAQISKETPIIGEVINQNPDYVTALYGRWHLGGEKSTNQPSMRGFDSSFGKLSSLYKGTNSYFIRNMFDANGKHISEEEYSKIGEPLYENGKYYNLEDKYNGNPELYTDELVTEKALDFIKENKEKPFFLYLAYSLSHEPMEIPESSKLYKDTGWPEKEKTYASMVSFFDGSVGKFKNLIEELGLSENTIFIVTSDNGPHSEDGHSSDFFDSNGALKGEKRDLYEGGIRVPFIASWKGKIAAGTKSDTQFAFWDYLPTFCDIAGVKSPSNIDGISFLPTLLGEKQKQTHKYLYWEFSEGGPKQAIRKGDWKAIRFIKDKRIELYDLITDLGENDNVATQNPEKLAELVKLMKEAHSKNDLFPLYASEGKYKDRLSKN